jgi:hypothetical protein
MRRRRFTQYIEGGRRLNVFPACRQPHEIDRAFIGWAKKFTKGKPPA